MDECTFDDALTGASIAFDKATGSVQLAAGAAQAACKSLFFPGCSLMTYALPLVQAVDATLREAGEVDGFTPLCCGKILEYEPHGKELRASFEDDLTGLVAASGAERIVAATASTRCATPWPATRARRRSRWSRCRSCWRAWATASTAMSRRSW